MAKYGENGGKKSGGAEWTGDGLFKEGLDRLNEIFSGLPAARPEDFSGRRRCRWLAGTVDRILPGPLKPMRAAVAGSSLFPWKGMEFEAREGDGTLEGVNLLLSLERGGTKAFKFVAGEENSLYDEKPCLVFDYDAAGNPAPFRLLRDEVRAVNPNLHLGRGNIRLGGRFRFIAYFTIESA